MPPKSKTTSLRSGYLLQSRLREMRVAGQCGPFGPRGWPGARRGDGGFGLWRGGRRGVGDAGPRAGRRPVADHAAVGAGHSRRFDGATERPRLVRPSTARFHKSDRNGQSGVAKPKRDNYIELAVHPRYKHNIDRYVRVIRSIALHESPGRTRAANRVAGAATARTHHVGARGAAAGGDRRGRGAHPAQGARLAESRSAVLLGRSAWRIWIAKRRRRSWAGRPPMSRPSAGTP